MMLCALASTPEGALWVRIPRRWMKSLEGPGINSSRMAAGGRDLEQVQPFSIQRRTHDGMPGQFGLQVE
jgi:hypothetical protein